MVISLYILQKKNHQFYLGQMTTQEQKKEKILSFIVAVI